jgi:hypothetical protein
VIGSNKCGLVKCATPMPASARPDNRARREPFLDMQILSDQAIA